MSGRMPREVRRGHGERVGGLDESRTATMGRPQAESETVEVKEPGPRPGDV
jgi:hypothetical protein